MLSGAIFYYSNTGNTLAACRYLQKRVRHASLELIDIIRCGETSIAPYDAIGFAFFTDTWRPPALFLSRCAALRDTAGKPAFSLNTFGCISGKSVQIMSRTLSGMGMTRIGAHSLHTPENYPPMVAGGNGFADSPSEKELSRFDAFIRTLDDQFSAIDAGLPPAPSRVRSKIIDAIVPAHPDKLMNLFFGKVKMTVEEARCIQCGRCARLCPAAAIAMEPHAVIDTGKCTRCWSCYNHCPSQAIHTGRFTGQGQYPHPPEKFLNKLS